MIEFVKLPHLPTKPVKTVLIGTYDDKIRDFIASFCPCVWQIDLSKNLDMRIAHHVDLKVLHLLENTFVVDYSALSLIDKMKKAQANVTLSSNAITSPYPNDCALNSVIIGKSAFVCEKATDKKVISFLKENSYDIIWVKQGYTKCSVLPINENAFITDDVAICQKGQENGFDCLFVEKGDVFLDGFDYGFIGGCAGLIDKNHLLFFGDISKHRNFASIELFLQKHGCVFDYISDFPLTDIGSIVPFSYDCVDF